MESGSKFTKSTKVIEGKEYTVYVSKNKIKRDLDIKWELTEEDFKNSIDLEDKSDGE
jgi:hypothetical protein